MHQMAKKADFRDVQIAFYRDGIEGVESLIEAEQVSNFTLRRAVSHMRSEGDDNPSLDSLEEALKERGHLSGLSGKPDAGDVKDYKVQQGDGCFFLRVPVDHLGVTKGDSMRVRFFVDAIKLERIE